MVDSNERAPSRPLAQLGPILRIFRGRAPLEDSGSIIRGEQRLPASVRSLVSRDDDIVVFSSPLPRNISQATFLHISPPPRPPIPKPPSSSTTDNDITYMMGMTARVVLDVPTRFPLIVPHELHIKLKTGSRVNQHVDVICNGISQTQAGRGAWTACLIRHTHCSLVASFCARAQLSQVLLFQPHAADSAEARNEPPRRAAPRRKLTRARDGRTPEESLREDTVLHH